MSRPDEGLIHTWLDGECTPEESARIEALVASDPAWAAAVAEARGLVAASSRILGALDAVPDGVLPTGTPAAPVERARGFRVRPWMGIAAGLVLVAGTAIVLRERAEEAFAPSAAVADMAVVETPAVSTQTGLADAAPTESAAAIATTLAVPTDIPAIGPARVVSGGAGVGGASVGAATTSMSGAVAAAPFVAERAIDARRAMEAGRAAETARAEESTRSREQDVQRVMAPPPAAPPLAARAPSGFAEAAKALAPNTLAGCWRVSIPQELAALLRDPVIVRTAGDTLVLQVTRDRQVTVVRTDDQLRGELTALREACPALNPPPPTPQDRAAPR